MAQCKTNSTARACLARHQSDHPHRGRYKTLAITFTILLFVAGCSTPSPTPTRKSPRSENSIHRTSDIDFGNGLHGRVLTLIGENSQAQFHPDGKRILFTSRARASHPNMQIYEVDLISSRESRITYQSGDAFSAIYTPSGDRVLYCSTTDERKEASPTPTPSSPFPPSEIYHSTPDGFAIERLTTSPGFDGDISWWKPGQKIWLVSHRPGQSLLQSLDVNRGTPQLHLQRRDVILREPRTRKNGTGLVWVEWSSDMTKAELWIRENLASKARRFLGPFPRLQNPVWTPDGTWILLSADRKGSGELDLFALDPQNNCIKQITKLRHDEFEPAISDDGKHLLFTGNQSGSSQIYLLDFVMPVDCLALD